MNKQRFEQIVVLVLVSVFYISANFVILHHAKKFKGTWAGPYYVKATQYVAKAGN